MLHGVDISPDGSEQFLEDLESTNGTFIGPAQYPLQKNKIYQLVHNKLIQFGPVKTRYELLRFPHQLGEFDTQTVQLMIRTC